MRSGKLSLVFIVLLAMFITSCGKKEAKVIAQTPQATVEKAPIAEKAVPSVPKEASEVPKPPEAVQVTSKPITEYKTLFGFEKGFDGFEIPEWQLEQESNAGKQLTLSKNYASEGVQSVCVTSEFPGKIWSASLIELEQYIDLSQYREISADVYLPVDAPLGLKAKLVLTVGEEWQWTEMSRSVPLVPGQWVTVSGSLEDGSMDWKRAEVNSAFRSDVRKIVVRIESNKRPVYSGPVYIDNIRLGK